MLNKFFISKLRAVDPTSPQGRPSRVAGTSNTEGRVVRRQEEVRKALAFMERWLQAGGATENPGPEQGRARGRDCRWVDSGQQEGTQVRDRSSIGNNIL